MEASALTRPASPQALLGRSPLLRLQSDEKLVAMTRRGNPTAFDALVQRYSARLQAFCRHMLGSTEDAEDVLQEVFASAYNAMVADERPINVRPWLYRIARNRSLNHLRRPHHTGQDSMDVFERAGGESTADAVHRREDFRLLVADVRELPESQRTALLMREMDALSYEQIAEAMDTTVPSVKSLLVRARVGLAEAAEARMLTCADVRVQLAEAAEGIAKVAPAVRRHVKGCDRCRVFRTELRRTTRGLAAVYPVGPLVVLDKLLWSKLGVGGGSGAGAGTGGSGLAGGSTVAGGSAWGGGGSALVGGGAGAGGLLSTGVGAMATKAAAGLVAAAVVTAGAVEIRNRVAAPAEERRAVAADELRPEVIAEGSHGPYEAASPHPDPALVTPPSQPPAAVKATAAGAATGAEETAAGTAPEAEGAAAAAATQAEPNAVGASVPVAPAAGEGSGAGAGAPVSGSSGGGVGPTPKPGAAVENPSGGGGGPATPPGGAGEPSPAPTAPPGDPTGSASGPGPVPNFGAGEPKASR